MLRGIRSASSQLPAQLPLWPLKPAGYQSQAYKAGISKTTANGASFCLSIGTTNRQTLSNNPGHEVSPTSLQEPTAAKASGPSTRRIHLSQEAKLALQWWSDNLNKCNRKCLRRLPLNLEIKTDASQRGWGTYSDGVLTGGCWNGMEAALNINAQKLLATLYGIKAFTQRRTKLHILLLTDNITVVVYVNHLGGTMSKILVTIVKEQGDNHHALDWRTSEQTRRHLSDRTDWMISESEVGLTAILMRLRFRNTYWKVLTRLTGIMQPSLVRTVTSIPDCTSSHGIYNIITIR